MSTGMDQELRTAFEAASDFVQPRPGLADRARARVRRRHRWLLAATAASCALALGAGVTAYAVLGHPRQVHVPLQPGGSPQVLATVDYDVTQLAVSGPYLYVLAGQNSLLSAYDRASGTLIAQIKTPSDGSALAVGPGGLVWLAYAPDQGRGPSGVWLLSPDLSVHSSAAGVQVSTILPTGRTSALIPSQSGLALLRMAGPGQPGTATQRPVSGTRLGKQEATADGWSGQVGGQTAVEVASGRGPDDRIVIAGQPGLRFGGAPATQVSSVTDAGGALWMTTFAMHDGESSLEGPLVRLTARLTPSTPSSVRASAVLARSESVWSDGNTVWVATGVAGHNLVCFTVGSTTGPVTTMPVSGETMALAATSRTVYVNALQPPGSYAPSHITGYPVPAACK